MREMSAREALKVGESFAAHVAAIILGLVLMIVAIGMGVTMIMLPFGIPIGFVGLGVFFWGVWGFGEAKARRSKPPA